MNINAVQLNNSTIRKEQMISSKVKKDVLDEFGRLEVFIITYN